MVVIRLARATAYVTVTSLVATALIARDVVRILRGDP
jgi:hypothetical protein